MGLCALAAGLACTGAIPSDPPPVPPRSELAAALPTGREQLSRLCARGLGDPVSIAFCSAGPDGPRIESLVDLQRLLGLDFKPGNIDNGLRGNPAFVLTGNSSSLAAQGVSAINPRALIFTPPNRRARVSARGARLPQNASCDDIEPIAPLPKLVVMGFARGENFVELIAKDPTANGPEGNLNFFIFQFERACERSARGCLPGDLLLPAAEAGFTANASLYQDIDLANTVLDCAECHQPQGPGTRKRLLMQELQNPWAHFFRNNRINGQVLMADYQAAHGTQETYAGIPGEVIFNPGNTETAGLASVLTESAGPDPAALQGLVENEGFCRLQDNEYITVQIQGEITARDPAQPAVNVPPGRSPTWDALFAASVSGQAIPTPYHDVKVTDPDALAALTRAYARARTGELAAADLPDIRDVFLASALPELSFRAAPGLDGLGILRQMCSQCHNGRLDQQLSRARFSVDGLASLSREEKDLAIARLRLPKSSELHMPPPRFRTLSEPELEVVVEFLSH